MPSQSDHGKIAWYLGTMSLIFYIFYINILYKYLFGENESICDYIIECEKEHGSSDLATEENG